MIRRRNKYHIKPLNWLLATFTFGLIESTTDLLIYLLEINSHPEYARFQKINIIPYGLGIFMLYLYAESIEGRQPSPIRLFSVTLLMSSSWAILIYDMFSDNTVDHDNARVIYDSLFDLFQISAVSFLVYVLWKSYFNARNIHYKKITRLTASASSIFLIAATYDLFKDIFNFPGGIHVLFYSLALLTLAITYIVFPYYLFVVTEPIYSLIVTTRSGVLLYIADLKKGPYPVQDELMGTALSAVNTLFKEAFDELNPVKEIYLESKSILVAQNSVIMATLVAEKNSQALYEALNQFLIEFYDEFKDELYNAKSIYKIDLDKTLPIVLRCLPFLDSDDVISLINTKEGLEKNMS